MATAVSSSPFRRYVRELRGLTEHAVANGGMPLSAVEIVNDHLDGRAGHELRRAVDIEELRRLGAFFTGERLAEKLLERAPPPSNWQTVIDPACGCGDLLLATASRLPLRDDLESTLRYWGLVLHGTDKVHEFIAIARYRLILLALLRGAKPSNPEGMDLERVLPGVRVGDGYRGPETRQADVIVVNPPYGQIRAPSSCEFGTGLVSEAALWIDSLTARARTDAVLLAILPDVLRSGSRYSRWRAIVGARTEIGHLQPVGRFDALTDVDVFLVSLRRTDHSATGWPGTSPSLPCLGGWCTVMVGPVVDRRDPKNGPRAPYVTPRELPQSGAYTPSRRRRYARRLFAPPFVVVRRTSRPTVGEPRLRPVVITGREPVAVENHLLVLVPKPHTKSACLQLAARLQEPSVTDWLNQRIRLRHLTVTALRELPLPQQSQKPRRGA